MNSVPESRQEKQTTLVLGGTCKTERRVGERLTARGLPVRIGSRSADPPFHWEERATLAPALDGVGSVSEVVDGCNASTTDDVRRVLGREPRDLSDYARAPPPAASGMVRAKEDATVIVRHELLRHATTLRESRAN